MAEQQQRELEITAEQQCPETLSLTKSTSVSTGDPEPTSKATLGSTGDPPEFPPGFMPKKSPRTKDVGGTPVQLTDPGGSARLEGVGSVVQKERIWLQHYRSNTAAHNLKTH